MITGSAKNKEVSVMTNYDTVNLSTVQRYEREKKKTDTVQLGIINTCNKGKRSVNLHKWLLEKHSIAIRGKRKWYRCLLTSTINMAIIYNWLIYSTVSFQPMTLMEFRRKAAVSNMKAASVNRESPHQEGS